MYVGNVQFRSDFLTNFNSSRRIYDVTFRGPSLINKKHLKKVLIKSGSKVTETPRNSEIYQKNKD